MAISDVLAKLLELLGLKTSEKKRILRMERPLRANKALNEDRLDALKDQIGRIERKILKKKSEYAAAKGDTKRIVGGEIERLFKELDQFRGQEDILGRNLEQNALALGKLEEIKAAWYSGVDESVFDGLALELQDIVVELKAGDQAARELQSVQYARPAADTVNIDARMAALEADATETPSSAPQRETEPAEGLSQASLNRLKELDAEE